MASTFTIGGIIPLMGMIGKGELKFCAYSPNSKVGPWVGWLEDAAGAVHAFVKRDGTLCYQDATGGFSAPW